MKIYPGSLAGEIPAVSSKSHAHRLLISSALSRNKSTVEINNVSDDISATIRCLEAMGAEIERIGNLFHISPIKGKKNPVLNCGESGSTLRFLLPVACALGLEPTFTGEGRLPERPLSPLYEELTAHGCRLSGKTLPLKAAGRLTGGEFSIAGNISSQFLSGLLFALPITEEGGEIRILPPVESASYIDLTANTLKSYGIEIKKAENTFAVKGNQTYSAPEYSKAEGDWSNAAFWTAAGAMAGDIRCDGIDRDSPQGDRKIAEILKAFGCVIFQEQDSVRTEKSDLKAISINAADIPDLVPILAVTASAAEGTTEIYNAQRLRIKESDRLHAIADCISKIGGDIKETNSGLIIKGKKTLDGGTVNGYNDHRIVMSMAIASLICKNPVIINGAEAVNKSYPDFFADFKKLGGKFDVI